MFLTAVFEAFSFSHGVAVVFIALLVFFLVRFVRKKTDEEHKWLRYSLAILLAYTPLSGPINALFRFDDLAWEKIYETEFPLYLCDIVAVILCAALILKNQRLTEIGYLWAMAGTAQGLITPVLSYDWPSLEYFCFFIQHGLAPIAAILLVWGFGLEPQKGAYKRVWIWTWGYLLVVMSLNFLLETNYGYLNGKPNMPTAYDYLGDYPWYLLSLHGIAATAFWLLLLPFRKSKKELE